MNQKLYTSLLAVALVCSGASLALRFVAKGEPPKPVSEPDLIEISSTTVPDWDPYTPEERAKFKADRKRRGHNTFGIEIANDGTNIVLLAHDYSSRSGGGTRLIYPMTNRFVQVAFYYNGEFDVSQSNASIHEVVGNVHLSDEKGFWITPNLPDPGEGMIHYSNSTIIHMEGGEAQ